MRKLTHAYALHCRLLFIPVFVHIFLFRPDNNQAKRDAISLHKCLALMTMDLFYFRHPPSLLTIHYYSLDSFSSLSSFSFFCVYQIYSFFSIRFILCIYCFQYILSVLHTISWLRKSRTLATDSAFSAVILMTSLFLWTIHFSPTRSACRPAYSLSPPCA